MAEEQPMHSASIDGFFLRCGLDVSVRSDCDEFLATNFPKSPIEPARTQGYCSYTVPIKNCVVQFRPAKYKLDLNVTAAATAIYGAYAPCTAYLGCVQPHELHAYTMERMRGVSYNDFMMKEHAAASKSRETLCEDFALFLARAWHDGARVGLSLGPIGSTIHERLEMLSRELPPRFRAMAKHVLSQYHLINTLPLVLAHGDIVPSNILVDPSTGHLVGLVDWAEAEMLPFGICLYGLEEILGYMTKDRFIYHENAEKARAAFWAKLLEEIPQLAEIETSQAVLLAYHLGVLLWHGFAFDDGAINRVVDEDRDRQEIRYLDALLAPHITASIL